MRLKLKQFFVLPKSILLATIFASLAINLVSAQDSRKTVSLAFRKPVSLAFIPFDKVEVLDNRIDSTKFYTYQTGNYPVISVGLGENGADSIEKYLADAVKSLPHKEGSILINIKQLRVCNRQYIPRKVGRKTFNFRMRDNISLTADIFFKTGVNAYKKLIAVDKQYYTPSAEFAINDLPIIFDNLIEMAAIAQDSLSAVMYGEKIPNRIKRLQKEVAYLKTVSDSATMTVDEININIKAGWALLPIIKNIIPLNGVYLNFDDFRDVKPVAAHFKISYSGKDSLYEVTDIKFDTSKSSRVFYAICDSGNLYIPITANRYQRLERFENTFVFSIPYSLPDLYAMLSMPEYSAGKSGSSSGNILIDLTAIVAVAVVDGLITDSKNKKITKKGLQSQQYRRCFIDMVSGDFIY